MDDACENTQAKRVVGRPFEPGNPGKPKGARHKLQEDFVKDVLAAWQTDGKTAITSMIADKPGDFVKMVASLIPKDVNLNVNSADEMSDAELAERIANLAAQLAPFLPGGTGNADQDADGAQGTAIAPIVH
jgi:hypothetical protein